MPKISFLGSYKFRIHFFDRGSCWRKQRWNSLYGHISRENAPVHTSTGASARARARAQPSTRFIRLHGKNVSKLCFWLWGKEPCSASRRTQRYVNSGCSLFFQGSNGVSQVCLLTNVYKQGPVRCWIFTSFNNERWSSPSYKRFRSWFRTADGMCFAVIALKCSSLFSSAHGAPPPGARLFPERIVKLYLSFINMIKLKTFWRYEGCSTTLKVLKINMRLGETVCVMPPLSIIWFHLITVLKYIM